MALWVVTGGVGFIGSHVCRALLERGDEVRIFDDFSDAPYPAARKEANAKALVATGLPVSVVRGTVTDRTALEPLMVKADGIVHLAGLAGVRPSFDRPAEYAEVNVMGTALVLELAVAHGIERVTMASSSSVYGNSTPLPAREDAPCEEPESPYAASKRGAELIASAYVKRAPRLACSALRFFTVYGPRQRPEMAIAMFMRRVMAGEPITMFGDGSMRRDFTHADDIARGVLAALDSAPPGLRAYNLGSGSPIGLRDLIDAIGETVGRTPRVERVPVPLGDVDATFADITRAQAELGWAPRVALADGLRTVHEWLRADG